MTKPQRQKPRTIPVLEWIAGGAGLLLVLATLAFIGSEAWRGNGGPPDLHVEVETIAPGTAGHGVAVVVRNTASRAAANVIVEAVAGDRRAEAHIDYVAGRSEARATLMFADPPDRGALSVRVIGYTGP